MTDYNHISTVLSLILFKSIYYSIKLFIDSSLGEVLMYISTEMLIDVNLYSNRLGV